MGRLKSYLGREKIEILTLVRIPFPAPEIHKWFRWLQRTFQDCPRYCTHTEPGICFSGYTPIPGSRKMNLSRTLDGVFQLILNNKSPECRIRSSDSATRHPACNIEKGFADPQGLSISIFIQKCARRWDAFSNSVVEVLRLAVVVNSHCVAVDRAIKITLRIVVISLELITVELQRQMSLVSVVV